MNKAIVLLSGGQDSATSLFWAINQFGGENVHALSFNYGQKHAVELELAQEIATLAGVPIEIINVEGTLRGSALVEHDKDVSAQHEINPSLPASFTPGRNALFLTLAASVAYTKGFNVIVVL